MKVKGFTILEMTVVMLITSLVVSFGYGGYLMIAKYHSTKVKDHEVLTDINRLRQIISYDCFESDTIRWDNESNTLLFRGNRSLQFEDSLAILDIGRLDTLYVDHSELKIEELTLKGGQKVVSSISMTIEHDAEEIQLKIEKEYTDYYRKGL